MNDTIIAQISKLQNDLIEGKIDEATYERLKTDLTQKQPQNISGEQSTISTTPETPADHRTLEDMLNELMPYRAISIAINASISAIIFCVVLGVFFQLSPLKIVIISILSVFFVARVCPRWTNFYVTLSFGAAAVGGLGGYLFLAQNVIGFIVGLVVPGAIFLLVESLDQIINFVKSVMASKPRGDRRHFGTDDTAEFLDGLSDQPNDPNAPT